ncbi:DUF2975 domain-containing protein [Microlunatus parietis]|uniref:DUF2975 domain-containing protein n=1 Tax=Microlunatus parietis TaxID=682979 RepID=A0A7Y9LBN8_9ACTN|nr:DUF2975 domain-containing protein [Microlunatus parietis]NYE70845.1 hypothetical protein [Microlunatus parietis]
MDVTSHSTGLTVFAVQFVTGYSVPISAVISRTVGELAALPPGVQVTGVTQILITEPTIAQTALWLTERFVPVGIAAGVAVVINRIVGSAMAGDPFSGTNLRRIRTVGLLLLFGGVVAAAVSVAAQWLIAWISLGDGAGTPVLMEPPMITLAGVVVLAISEVMPKGAALRAELDEVV